MPPSKPQPRNGFEEEDNDPLLEIQSQQLEQGLAQAKARERQQIISKAQKLGITLGNSDLELADNGDLVLLGCHGGKYGLDVRPDITADELTRLGNILFVMEDGIQLYIGDMLASAEQLGYGDITAIAEYFNRDEHTLRNWKWICSSVKTSLRKDVYAQYPQAKALTISHYNLVAPLPPDQQATYLTQAVRDNLTVAQLRALITPKSLPATTTERDLPTLTRDIIRLWEKKRRSPAQSAELAQYVSELEAWLTEIKAQIKKG